MATGCGGEGASLQVSIVTVRQSWIRETAAFLECLKVTDVLGLQSQSRRWRSESHLSSHQNLNGGGHGNLLLTLIIQSQPSAPYFQYEVKNKLLFSFECCLLSETPQLRVWSWRQVRCVIDVGFHGEKVLHKSSGFQVCFARLLLFYCFVFFIHPSQFENLQKAYTRIVGFLWNSFIQSTRERTTSISEIKESSLAQQRNVLISQTGNFQHVQGNTHRINISWIEQKQNFCIASTAPVSQRGYTGHRENTDITPSGGFSVWT